MSDDTQSNDKVWRGPAAAEIEGIFRSIYDNSAALRMKIQMYVADAAYTVHQVKVYPKHRARSPIHHRRMQKKWLKRYGKYLMPAMYWVQHPAAPGGKLLVVHPALVAELRLTCKSAGIDLL